MTATPLGLAKKYIPAPHYMLVRCAEEPGMETVIGVVAVARSCVFGVGDTVVFARRDAVLLDWTHQRLFSVHNSKIAAVIVDEESTTVGLG